MEVFRAAGQKLELTAEDAAAYDQKMQEYEEAQKGDDRAKDGWRVVATAFPRYALFAVSALGATCPMVTGIPALSERCRIRGSARGVLLYALSRESGEPAVPGGG